MCARHGADTCVVRIATTPYSTISGRKGRIVSPDQRKKHREAGKCGECGKPAISGHTHCEAHLAARRARKKIRRERRFEHCEICGERALYGIYTITPGRAKNHVRYVCFEHGAEAEVAAVLGSIRRLS